LLSAAGLVFHRALGCRLALVALFGRFFLVPDDDELPIEKSEQRQNNCNKPIRMYGYTVHPNVLT
jgi:hypothetical protein